MQPVLTGTASERNWSNFGFIHSGVRTRLTPGRAADLVYVFGYLGLPDKVDRREEIEYHMWDVDEVGVFEEVYTAALSSQDPFPELTRS